MAGWISWIAWSLSSETPIDYTRHLPVRDRIASANQPGATPCAAIDLFHEFPFAALGTVKNMDKIGIKVNYSKKIIIQ